MNGTMSPEIWNVVIRDYSVLRSNLDHTNLETTVTATIPYFLTAKIFAARELGIKVDKL